MPRFGHPHEEVRAAGIYHGDRVMDRERGRLGTVSALSTVIPAVYVRWDKPDGGEAKSAKLTHLDAIRLL